ncbi:hypothetical protein EK21DRAFT_56184 [Setomelanomma holmii]|uniref:Uncharacterized protein n=1 Tax=Setomelanomma holmii TaxID=210430 RepID=A0A9P4HGC7_9PLEO|nr:hypothetical protein EK21DRAFT_56184 [Setomelanomma holmii]
MNASATIRASYIRQAHTTFIPAPRHLSIPSTISSLSPRPASDEKLHNFQQVNHIGYREKCNHERSTHKICFDVEKNADTEHSYIDIDWMHTDSSFGMRVRKMYTIIPYRDPIYLVAIVFLLGSIDLIIDAFFDLLPHITRGPTFETRETVAIPTTVLLGSILFFAAGIFDTFGALNADHGTLVESKEDIGKVTFRPALLGSPEFKWLPSGEKFVELAMRNLAFQAGLLVLFGGVIFMFAGIVDFPGLVPEKSRFFGLVVFGPQVVHGAFFFVANIMLAVSAQNQWYRFKFYDADWLGAFLNAVGGFGFMITGLFLFGRDEFRAAIAAMIGSWAFLIGSLLRWYVVMEFW